MSIIRWRVKPTSQSREAFQICPDDLDYLACVAKKLQRVGLVMLFVGKYELSLLRRNGEGGGSLRFFGIKKFKSRLSSERSQDG